MLQPFSRLKVPLPEKCPNMDFFSGPYLDTFHALLINTDYFNVKIIKFT